MNKPKVVRLIALAGILGLCGFLYVSTMLPQDLRFRKYKEAFRKIHHPEHTRFVGNYKLLGVLDYQRTMYKETYTQGCDYIFGEIREYTDSQENVEAFYTGQIIMVGQEKEGISVWFIPMNENGHIDRNGWTEYGPNGMRLLQNITASLFTGLDPSKSYYFVFVWDLELSKAESDIRCLL